VNVHTEAPAAAKQTGATDKSATDRLQVHDSTNESPLGNYPLFGTPEQAAAVLQCSVNKIRQMCREGRLPSFKVGRLIRIARTGLLTFIDNGGN
jgi:excisionase family DNA binding protein